MPTIAADSDGTVSRKVWGAVGGALAGAAGLVTWGYDYYMHKSQEAAREAEAKCLGQAVRYEIAMKDPPKNKFHEMPQNSGGITKVIYIRNGDGFIAVTYVKDGKVEQFSAVSSCTVSRPG